MNYIKKKHITLRGLSSDDVSSYRKWWDNSEVTQYMETGWCPCTEAMEKDFLNKVSGVPNAILFGIEENQRKQLIGFCGLYEIFWPGRRAEFRILIGESNALGKGFGTEATKAVIEYGFIRGNLEVIHLGVNVKNIGAIKAYEKAGFVEEGTRRNYVYSRGEYCDAIMMSILRTEFLEKYS